MKPFYPGWRISPPSGRSYCESKTYFRADLSHPCRSGYNCIILIVTAGEEKRSSLKYERGICSEKAKVQS
ncbi:hypothetical protein MSMAT_0994 [Methanosarcina mazei TMA]|nr:hypothetical protein MSMAT_0994 [Methanosarcina mazei TMA]